MDNQRRNVLWRKVHTHRSLSTSLPHVHNEEGRLLSYSLFFFFLELRTHITRQDIVEGNKQPRNGCIRNVEFRERELRKSESSLYKNLSRPPGSFLFLPYFLFLHPNVGCFVRCTRTKRLLLFLFFAIVHQ